MHRFHLLAPLALLLTAASAAAVLPSSASGPAVPGITDFLLGDSLVGAWSFEEGSGTITADSSRSGLAGLIHNATWVDGQVGKALDFDGHGDGVELIAGAPTELHSLDEGTISLWFRIDTVPGERIVHPLFYFGDGVGGLGNSSLIIEVGHFHTQTNLFFTIVTDEGEIPQCFNTLQNLIPGKLYHFAAVVDADPSMGPNLGYNTGYLNGVELLGRHYRFGGPRLAYFFNDIVDAQETWFGRGFYATDPELNQLDGLLDEIKVWDRPLSSREIEAYYQSTVVQLEARLAE